MIGDRPLYAITFHLPFGCRSQIALIDWGTFAQIAASLLLLHRITVQVKKNSEQAAAYMEHAHLHLASLVQRRGIDLDVPGLEAAIASLTADSATTATPILPEPELD